VISYAQNFEDVIVNRVFDGKMDGFYIDVGASDPTVDSVTRHFYELGWRGINIEPASDPFRALHEERPRDINLNVAVGSESGYGKFFEVEVPGLSTLRADLASRLEKQGLGHATRQVEVMTLAEVCRRHVDQPIDFLKVDAEGSEEEVLQGGDWVEFRPAVVLLEAIVSYGHVAKGAGSNSLVRTVELSRKSFISLLTREEYDLAYFDGLNEFYVAREAAHLKAAMNSPPNVFDRFVPYRQVELERRLAVAERRIDELEQKLAEARSEATYGPGGEDSRS
jgi:FkbM family methyltransferase